MKWPTGKYNGRRIDGFKISFSLHLLYFVLKPILNLKYGQPYFIWLWFTLRAELEFETGNQVKSINEWKPQTADDVLNDFVSVLTRHLSEKEKKERILKLQININKRKR